jgi:predicted nucleotidyltransferase component of viral defense system
MIGFGELRRLSRKWQVDIAVVERVHALDWLIRALFGESVFEQGIALSAGTALSKAYFPNYPPIEDADLVSEIDLDRFLFESLLNRAADSASRDSGLRLKLHSIHGSEARFEFTGPLGRRSAAQPHLSIRLQPRKLRTNAFEGELIHPFAEHFEATVRSISLEELTAGLIGLFAGKPRARDIFDLWFVLQHGCERLDRGVTRDLVRQLEEDKGHSMQEEIDPAHRMALARAWESGLKNIREKPTFIEAEASSRGILREILLRKL